MLRLELISPCWPLAISYNGCCCPRGLINFRSFCFWFSCSGPWPRLRASGSWVLVLEPQVPCSRSSSPCPLDSDPYPCPWSLGPCSYSRAPGSLFMKLEPLSFRLRSSSLSLKFGSLFIFQSLRFLVLKARVLDSNSWTCCCVSCEACMVTFHSLRALMPVHSTKEERQKGVFSDLAQELTLFKNSYPIALYWVHGQCHNWIYRQCWRVELRLL